MKMKTKRCICGCRAQVDEWNSKGISLFCPECGVFGGSRDDLYETALAHRMTLAFIGKYCKSWKKDAKDEDVGDESYRSACEMAAEMVDEMWKEYDRVLEAWGDEKTEEVDYLSWSFAQ